jgi:hypothetical protein
MHRFLRLRPMELFIYDRVTLSVFRLSTTRDFQFLDFDGWMLFQSGS